MRKLKNPRITKIRALETIICLLSQTRATFHLFNSSEFQRTSTRKCSSKGAFELPPMQKSAPEGALIDVRHHLGASNGQAQEAKGKAWV